VQGATARYEVLKNAINRCTEKRPTRQVGHPQFHSSVMTDIAVGLLRVLEHVIRYKTINLINDLIFYLEEGIEMSSETLVTN